MRRHFAILAPLALTACVGYEPPLGPPVALINSAGRSVGTVQSWETPGAVTFRINASGLPHGIHGLHVHTVGRCDAPAFESAGPHWNPAGARHGFNNPAGPHRGDLPNITVASNGVLQESVTLSGASLRAVGGAGQLLDGDGAALVIHATADDYTTDPSGNSGARIACAVLQANPAR